MNGQQRAAIEEAAKVFPRGLVAFTIAPNGALMLAQSTGDDVNVSQEDADALARLAKIVADKCEEDSKN